VVTDKTVIVLLLSEACRRLELQVAADMKKFGSTVALLHSVDGKLGGSHLDHLFGVPARFGDLFNPFLFMPLFQLFGYYHARFKGIHPDRPKNLTAVVTLTD